MKTLFMDSSHKHLLVVLFENNEVKASLIEECWKKQSEKLFPAVISCMSKANFKVDELDRIVVSIGPGSYTGVRIALSVAKVLGTTKQIEVYTLNTLQLYSGLNKNTFVLMDARSKRAYCACYDQGKEVLAPQVKTLDEIKEYINNNEVNVVGDNQLIGLDMVDIPFEDHIKALLPFAIKVDNIHSLVPCYLKESDAYGK